MMEVSKEKEASIARKRRRTEWWSKHAPKDKRMKLKSAPLRQKSTKQEQEKTKAVTSPEAGEQEEKSQKSEGKTKKRYILFLGNLPFTVKEEDVKSHFRCTGKDTIKQVRMLTKKTGESKGCAFLEFNNKFSYWKALNLHHSVIAGRKINVEVTCGGGGNGEKRQKRLRERKSKFRKGRKKNIKKMKEPC